MTTPAPSSRRSTRTRADLALERIAAEPRTASRERPYTRAIAKASEYQEFIAAVYRIVGAVERRFDALRESDRKAVELAHADLSHRLEGFPQQYATKEEMAAAASTAQRLEKDALPREVYDQQNGALLEAVNKLSREKLDESAYNTFVDNYRLELVRAQEDRRAVVEALSTATERVRAQVLEERGDYITQEAYDNAHSKLVDQVNGVQGWQYKMLGALVLASFVAPAITGVLVYLFTTGAL